MAMRARTLWMITVLAVVGASCGDRKPGVEVESWSLTSKGEGNYLFEALGRYTNPKAGVFHKQIETVDARGCHSIEYIEEEFVRARQGKDSSFVIKMPLRSKAKLATARFFVDFWDVDQGVSERGTPIFSEEKAVDGSIHPPTVPKTPCNNKKQELREKAKTDPEGADAEAIDSMSREEVIATAINSAGYLCAHVIDMYPRGSDIVVHCVEYRNGRGRVKYLVDAAAMTVTPA
jgi:hypothetical protein